jgi:hypothetical protein
VTCVENLQGFDAKPLPIRHSARARTGQYYALVAWISAESKACVNLPQATRKSKEL